MSSIDTPVAWPTLSRQLGAILRSVTPDEVGLKFFPASVLGASGIAAGARAAVSAYDAVFARAAAR